MIKKTHVAAAMLGAAVVTVSALPAFGAGQVSSVAERPRIDMSEARAAALKREPGKIEGAELEHEYGKFIYSFDIRNSNGAITEVHVSAISGKVISVAKESVQNEATEQRQESGKHAPASPDHGK